MIGRLSRSRADGRPHRPRPPAEGVWGALLGGLAYLLRRRRRIRPTREGWVFLGAALAVALAALNTGNNLLYLVFATQLSMIALSGVLSELSVQQLRLRRRLGSRLFAEVTSSGTWTVQNPRKRLPSLAITVSETPGRDASLKSRGATQVPVLPPQGQSELRGEWVFAVRGIHKLDAVRVATTWPFGIFEKYYEVAAPLEVLVHPRPAWDAPAVAAPRGSDDEGTASRRGGDGTSMGLKDHREGDDPRRVHWRTSARRGRLVSVERAEHHGGEVRIDVAVPTASVLKERVAEFEASLSQATAQVLQAERGAREVLLSLPGRPLMRTGGSDYGPVLTALALAELPESSL